MTFRRITALAFLLASGFAMAAPEPFGSEPVAQGRLFSIQGSNTIGAELAPNLVKNYLEAKGAEKVTVSVSGENETLISGVVPATGQTVSVAVAAHGSGTGFKGLLAHTADIAAASRPAKDKEVAALTDMADLHSPTCEHIIGIDGLAIIVNHSNPLNDLSVQEIAGIFSGEYQDWSELGGPAGPIHVYARDDKSGTWDSFKSMVLGEDKPLTASAERFESNADLSDTVSRDSQGIGFVGLSFVRSAKLLSVSDGTAKSLLPNKLTVATEDYALSRRLFMYTDDQPSSPLVSEFINFVLDDAGQKIVADTGFISQELKAVTPEFYEELPQDFRDITNNAKRLTINFRFQEGSAKLDNKALKDLERLVAYLSEHKADLVLVGFGDPKKTEKRSQLLSKLRAMAVRRELVRYGIYPAESVGYGDNLPVASVNGQEGRNKNRRVEVWVRNAS